MRFRPIVGIVATAVALAAAVPVGANLSFDPGAVQAWADEKRGALGEAGSAKGIADSALYEATVNAALDLRERVIGEPGILLAGTTPGDLGRAAGRRMYAEFPQVWQYFFSGAMVFVGAVDSGMPTAVFYNPYVDAAVVTTLSEGLVTDSVVVPGNVFHGHDTAVPAWMSDQWGLSLPFALNAQYREAARGIEAMFPPKTSPQAAFDRLRGRSDIATLEGRAFSSLASLDVIRSIAQAPDTLKSRTGEVFAAVRSKDETSLRALIPADATPAADELMTVPGELMQAMSPMYVVWAADAPAATVLFANPFAPRLFGSMGIDMTDCGANLDNFVMLDMEGSR